MNLSLAYPGSFQGSDHEVFGYSLLAYLYIQTRNHTCMNRWVNITSHKKKKSDFHKNLQTLKYMGTWRYQSQIPCIMMSL